MTTVPINMDNFYPAGSIKTLGLTTVERWRVVRREPTWREWWQGGLAYYEIERHYPSTFTFSTGATK